MKPLPLLFVAVVMAVCAGGAPRAETNAPVAAAGTTRVVVTYFHGDQRCATCRKLETYSREAVEKTFPAEIASGRVVFKVVNTDRPENAHFRNDYGLVAAALVVAEERDGTAIRWTNLDQVWTLVRGDQQTYADYVAGGVRTYLGSAS